MLYTGKVKQVLSSDTIILTKEVPGKLPAERTLCLAYITSYQHRRDELGPGCEDYFNFFVREYLRTRLIGKDVTFRIFYSLGSQQPREFGNVYLGDRDIIQILLREGLAKLRDETFRREEISPDYLELLQTSEASAKLDGKGIWTAEPNIINLDLHISNDLFKEILNKPLPAVIERVANGDRLHARIFLTPSHHISTWLSIAGIHAPRSSHRPSEDGPGVEFYGDESLRFVESHLLQRNVYVSLVTSTQQGLPVALVTVGDSVNVAQKILEAGCATVSDWQSPYVGFEIMQSLRSAEAAARAAGIGLWKGKAQPLPAASPVKSDDYTVSRVISADTIVVRNAARKEMTISLASVRGPRQSDPTQAPFATIAKEFVRRLLIGKRVTVTQLGRRPASDGFDERVIATVCVQGEDVSLKLSEAGMVSIVHHRKGDTDRSPLWDQLLEVSSIAAKEKKGMFASELPPPDRTVNASETATKAKSFLNALVRRGRVPAVVDFVNSGSRFRVLIPRENVRISFILAGVRAPRFARNPEDTGEPFGQESFDYSSDRLMQRDVEVEVLNVDRTGAFIGLLYTSGSKEAFNVTLVREGLATVHEVSADKSPIYQELVDTQGAAKSAGINIWKNYIETVQSAGETNGSEEKYSDKVDEYIDIMVRSVGQDGTLYYSQLHAVGDLTKAMSALSLGSTVSNLDSVKKGEYALLNTATGGLRVQVVSVTKEYITVRNVDTGALINTQLTKLLPLPPTLSVQQIPPATKEATIAFVKFPPKSTGFLEPGIAFFKQLIEYEKGKSKPLAAGLLKRPGKDYIVLYDPETASSANDSLNMFTIAEGWAAANKSQGFTDDALQPYLTAENLAKQKHMGSFKFGDWTEDDEDQFF
ncbi:hypothetical protein CANCADRAFT_3171 [Tortispora caseinolytica NRRL Y-17796]|uniref:TNase-like domain-containing protein n=1 Tax=Tortispora caseinolytica NRRL Y-17796 TaxID=767744 RepID=A0A1E4T9V1_9ASCO|nr:hypothetical protein CANCADRAFT_3171 [Tortispora caseinolytica NRRL Y-17796]